MMAYRRLGSSLRRSGQKPVGPGTHVKPGVGDRTGRGACASHRCVKPIARKTLKKADTEQFFAKLPKQIVINIRVRALDAHRPLRRLSRLVSSEWFTLVLSRELTPYYNNGPVKIP